MSRITRIAHSLVASTHPKIDDEDALDRMARVEGESWKRQQLANKTSPYGFFAYRAAWDVLVKEGYAGEASCKDVLDMEMVPGVKNGGDGTIYGEGGYARYKVGRGGILLFDYGMVRKEKQQLARQEGFLGY